MRLLLAFILPLFCFTAMAQHKQFERYIGWNGNFVLLHSVTNKLQACTFVLKADSVKAFLSNGDSAYSELYCIPRALNENYLGAFIRDRKVYLYMTMVMTPASVAGCMIWKKKQPHNTTFPFR